MLTLRAALSSLCAVATCLTVEAQPRLVLSGRGPAATGSPTATMSIDLGTLGVEWIATTPWIEPLITWDGRYLVASPSPYALLPNLWVRDLETGHTLVVPLDGHVPGRTVAHPRRLEVFVWMTDGLIASITADGVRPISTCPESGGMDLSGDGRRLVLVCEGDIVVLDASSGDEIARFDGGSSSVTSPVASFDGSRVLVRQFVGPRGFDLAVWDVATQARIVEDISPPLSPNERLGSPVVAAPARDAVLVGTSWGAMPGLYGNRTLLVDSSTLVVRQLLPLVGRGTCKVGIVSGCLELSTAAFTADGRHVVAGVREPHVPSSVMVQIVELAANTLVASTGAGFFASDGVSLALASPPLPPEGVSAHVTGRDVTVSWSLPGSSPGVTAYILEAGSGPGMANLAVQSVPGMQTSIAFANVPPGRYYVRVRGENVTGRGNTSSEIVVEVS